MLYCAGATRRRQILHRGDSFLIYYIRGRLDNEDYYAGSAGRRQGDTGKAYRGKVWNSAHFNRRHLPGQYQRRHRAWLKGKGIHGSGPSGSGRGDDRHASRPHPSGGLQKRLCPGRLPEDDPAGGEP